MDLSEATAGRLLIPAGNLRGIAFCRDTLVGRGVKFGASPHVVHRTPTSELWLTGAPPMFCILSGTRPW